MPKRGFLDLTPAELLARRSLLWGLGFLAMPPLLTSCHFGNYLCAASWREEISPLVSMWSLFPWMASIAAVQIGGMGMATFGLLGIGFGRFATPWRPSSTFGFWLSVGGLSGLFVFGVLGYFALDAFEPSFFYIVGGTRTFWIAAQTPFVALYLVGAAVSLSSGIAGARSLQFNLNRVRRTV
jgi:hypothetical protein